MPAGGLLVWMEGDIERVLFDETVLHRRLDELAAQIPNDYCHRELTVIAVLTGSLMFVADLVRRIPLPLKLDCLSAVSYHGKTETSGQVIFKQVALPDATERDILILDDILDSGHTLAAIRDKLEAAKVRSIRICVLLSKKNHAPVMLMQITLGSKLKTNLSSATGWILWNVIATCPTSAC